MDDVLFSKSVRKHPPCQGIAGGCVVCLEHLAAAEADQRFWVELCSRLGLCLHPDKRQLCGQRAEYTGFVLDTILGRILMVEDKLAKLLTTVQEWVDGAQIKARGLAKVRGKAMHYAACIPFLRFYAVEVSLLLGTDREEDEESEFDWDLDYQVTSHMVALGSEMMEIIRRFAPRGKELWPLVPSTLYGRSFRRDV